MKMLASVDWRGVFLQVLLLLRMMPVKEATETWMYDFSASFSGLLIQP